MEIKVYMRRLAFIGCLNLSQGVYGLMQGIDGDINFGGCFSDYCFVFWIV